MPDYTRLRGVKSFAREPLLSVVGVNLVDYFNWACVQAGGFVDVPVPTPGVPSPYGEETLSVVHKEGVVDGAVWQASRTAWCHETGLDDDVAPTVARGVYVDGAYHPTASTTGAFAHRLDFPRGLVVFGSPVPRTSVVQVAYSYRLAHFTAVSDSWFVPVVLDGYLAAQTAGGVAGVLDEARLRTPFVAVEAAALSGTTGYELGSNNRWTRPLVLFHCIASNPRDRDVLAGVVAAQHGSTIALYDPNARRLADDFELDARGSPRPGKSSYAAAVDLYRYNTIRFRDVAVDAQPPRNGLWIATCRARMELVVGDA